ncbi:MAG: hypothetical protein PUD15_07600 [Prevotella sp.]|uniref:hypothetical protein n=1 Tax=Prevotella sp. AGR2160 TaxID=1280674 RepID=UPI0006866F34|nr:hypothetical protein [Prevotella sp. AGR2160]MDD5862404.1 hypothetical protein [Prevotella sp.]
MKIFKTIREHFFLGLLLILFSPLMAVAQPPMGGPGKGFNPEKFQKEMEQYITTTAGLSPVEAARFFPVYRQWKRQERALFDQRRRFHWIDVTSDRACREAISQFDDLDIKQKQLQQKYHRAFLKILPARKVFQIIRAEDEFHRKVFKQFFKRHH